MPAEILLEGLPAHGIAYLIRCYLFLAALFQTLEEQLAPKRELGVSGMATWFDAEFGVHAITKRREFFTNIKQKYWTMVRSASA